MPTSVKKAKYQQIAESLRSRLKSDEMKAGDRLPSFTQMYREHGASVATMSRVYELLENEGLIERRGVSIIGF
jgi:GntR family transcriptional regulator